MKTPLALHNLWHQGIRTLVSICGVAFALLLVFMQLGFMGAVSHTATNLLEHLEFDAMIRARDYLHLYESGQIDRNWLTVAQSTEGVSATQPLWITIQNWRTLPTQFQTNKTDFESQYLPIAVMAYEPHECVFDLPDIQSQTHLLFKEDAFLLDDSTQAAYGPWSGKRFSAADVGRDTEVGGRFFSVAGLFKLGTGLAANGALITSDRAFAKITPWDIRSTTSLGLVQFDPSEIVSHAEILKRLRQRMRLPNPSHSSLASFDASGTHSSDNADAENTAVDVLSKSEALAWEKFRWLWQTPFGLIFQMGVLLSLLVGAAIVYMVLSTDVANRLPEYATLLAMGYSRSYLASIVMTQAVVLCALGFFAAWAAAEGLYRLTYMLSEIPLMMTPNRVMSVALLGLFMSCASGLLALRKLWKAEPASLF